MIKHTLTFQPPVTVGKRVNVIYSDGSRRDNQIADILNWESRNLVEYELYVGPEPMDFSDRPAPPPLPAKVLAPIELLNIKPHDKEYLMLLSLVRAYLRDLDHGITDHTVIGALRAEVADYDNEPIWITPDGFPITRKLEAELKNWLNEKARDE
jgi:hypothetical protein